MYEPCPRVGNDVSWPPHLGITASVNRLLALVICLALLVGCASDTAARRQEAVDPAKRYIDAVRGGEADRGWSLLHPSAQDAWDSEADYVTVAENADWSTFTAVGVEALYCDDGVICPVVLDVESGEGSVPGFLHAPEKRASAGIYFRSVDGFPGNAEIIVVLPSRGGPGGVTLARG